MQDFRNLDVWQRARNLNKTIYQMTADFPESEAFGLRSQMRRASVSICSNIAEGCGHRGDREFRRFLDVAMGSACELECETILSFDLVFIPDATLQRVLAILIEIKRMLGGLISRLICSSPHRSQAKAQPHRPSWPRPKEPVSRAES
jgi:four helix bundle protein